METIISKTAIYALLLILVFLIGACGGGNESENSTNTTPHILSLTPAQLGLLRDVNFVLSNKDLVMNPDVSVRLSVLARDEPSSIDKIVAVQGNPPLQGNYFSILSDEEYVIVDTPKQKNKLSNHALVREPNQTDLGKVNITHDTKQDGELKITMLFNSAGNSVIAFSNFSDFVAGGTNLESRPKGNFNYSGKNYYKEASGNNEIQSGGFNLTVNFDQGNGFFNSGLSGKINVDVNTGNYWGFALSLADTSYNNIRIEGKFHGDNERSSVTGLYHEVTLLPTVPVVGAIIGNGTRN